MIYMTYDMIRF